MLSSLNFAQVSISEKSLPGFRTDIPRVGNSDTPLTPVDIVPVVGMGTHRPVNRVVSHETRGTIRARRCVLIHLPCNLTKATYTSSDVY
jgi:hypothetical protein